MKKVMTIARTDAAPRDVVFWKQQPTAQRLAALEQIRQEYMRWKYDHQPGFQRVYHIIKHASGRPQDLADVDNLTE